MKSAILEGWSSQVEQGNPQLLGHGRDQFDQPLKLLRQVVGQGLAFHGLVLPLSLKLRPGTHDRLGFEHFHHPGARDPVYDRVEAVSVQFHRLVYTDQCSEFVEIVRRRPVRLGVPLRQDQDHLVLLQCLVPAPSRNPAGRPPARRPCGDTRPGLRTGSTAMDSIIESSCRFVWISWSALTSAMLVPRFPCLRFTAASRDDRPYGRRSAGCTYHPVVRQVGGRPAALVAAYPLYTHEPACTLHLDRKFVP